MTKFQKVILGLVTLLATINAFTAAIFNARMERKVNDMEELLDKAKIIKIRPIKPSPKGGTIRV